MEKIKTLIDYLLRIPGQGKKNLQSHSTSDLIPSSHFYFLQSNQTITLFFSSETTVGQVTECFQIIASTTRNLLETSKSHV